jgi:hypothetical protein
MESRLLSPSSKSPNSLPEVLLQTALIGVGGGVLFGLMRFPAGMVGEVGGAALQAAGFGVVLAKGLSHLQGKGAYEFNSINLAALGFGGGAFLGALLAGPESLLVGLLAALAGGASITMISAEGSGRVTVGAATAAGFFAATLIRWGFGLAMGPGATLTLLNVAAYLLPFALAGAAAGAGLFFAGTPHIASSEHRAEDLYDYESEGAKSDFEPPPEISTEVPADEAVIAPNCPNCGAPLDAAKKIARQTCPYCGSLLIVN